MKVEVVQATSSHYYHVVPSELQQMTLSPEQSAIFEYLSRIGSDRFVEFVTDVLVHVEGHKLLDKTDGPGDEKQDILTLDPAGHRHLTQCKHTMHYGDNSSGDELDLLVAACLRKNCRSALYVTNADLTVQAKRYVNDGEYLRGWPEEAEFKPQVDYWNGERIWKRIAGNGTILNKWFGGMAQSHGLRSFFADVVILQMPGGENCETTIPEIAAGMKRAAAVELSEDEEIAVAIGDALKLRIGDSFATPADLRIPFSDPRSGTLPLDVPFRALRVHAAVGGDGVYDPEQQRNKIAQMVGNALPELADGRWWYVAAGPPQAFIFLQDVARPVLVPIGSADTFIRVGKGATVQEKEWAFMPGGDFVASAAEGDEDELAWQHQKTGAMLRVLVEQGLPIWYVADVYLRQRQIRTRLENLAFRVIEAASAPTVAIVRNLCRPDWFVLQSSNGDLFWAYPEGEESDAEKMADVLVRQGLRVLSAGDEDRSSIIARVEAAPSESADLITSSQRDLLTPMQLGRRIFWLTDTLPVSQPLEPQRLINLATMKMSYEGRHGFDFLRGDESPRVAGEELRRILWDPLTLRGNHMLDIGVDANGLTVSLRVRTEKKHESAAEIVRECVEEMKSIKEKVAEILAA